jgi:lipopolysaccharide cholinephosphotransferase
MVQINDYILCKVHNVQLDMALEVKRICERHDINYSIIAGTLLGAARHEGFIPWDDDLDIGMLREDFNKFINICEKELDEKYFLQTFETDSGFALPIAKLRRNGTKFVEKNSSTADLHCGIYIDIFPFDNVPDGVFRRYIHNGSTFILKRILLVKSDYKVWKDHEIIKKLFYKSLISISKYFSVSQIKKVLLRQMTRYNNVSSEKVVTFGGAYGYNKESINKKWLELQNPIIFEGVKLSAPLNYKEYLTFFYGDYMTPPPENKRYNRHNIINISFEEDN